MSKVFDQIQESSFEWKNINSTIISDPAQVSDVIYKDNVDFYLLHEVCKHSPPIFVVENLLKYYEPAIRAKGPDDRLPIHLACEYGASAEVINLLIRKFCGSIRTKDINGMLPLHIACAVGFSYEIVDILLINYPEAISTEDSNGKTPEEYAKYLQDGEVKSKISDCLVLATVYESVSKAAVLNVTEQITSSVCAKMMGVDLSPLKEKEMTKLLSNEVVKFVNDEYSSEMITSELIDILKQSLVQFKKEVKHLRGESLKTHAKELEELADTIEQLQEQVDNKDEELNEQRSIEKFRVAKLENQLTEVTEIKITDGEELESIVSQREELWSQLQKRKQKVRTLQVQNDNLVEKLKQKTAESREVSKLKKREDALKKELQKTITLAKKLMDENTKRGIVIQRLRRSEKSHSDRVRQLETSLKKAKQLIKSREVALVNSINDAKRHKQKSKLLENKFDEADSRSNIYLRGGRERLSTMASFKTSKRDPQIPKTMLFDFPRSKERKSREVSLYGDEESRGLDIDSYYRHKSLIGSSIASSRVSKLTDKTSPKESISNACLRRAMTDRICSDDELDIVSLKLSPETRFKDNNSLSEGEEEFEGSDAASFHRHHELTQSSSFSVRGGRNSFKQNEVTKDDDSHSSLSSIMDSDDKKENRKELFLHQILDVDLSLSELDSEEELESTRKRVNSVLLGSLKDPNRFDRTKTSTSTTGRVRDSNKHRSSSVLVNDRLQDKMESLKVERRRSISAKRIPRQMV